MARKTPQSARREPNPPRNIAPTVTRRGSFPDHRPPTGRHSKGGYAGLWHGTKRVLDPGRRRAKNKRSWARLQRQARKAVSMSRVES